MTGPYYGISSLAIFGANIFAGTNEGVFLSTNNGTTWSNVNTGLPNLSPAIAFAVSSNDIFAGFSGRGVWRRPLAEVITGVEDGLDQVPFRFALEQNYPNPFNATTVINYQLPMNTLVTLKVYDALGRKVQTLLDEQQNAGTHCVTFIANNLPSGVYYYSLEAGTYNATRKLVLVK